jgi:hypothetical protein
VIDSLISAKLALMMLQLSAGSSVGDSNIRILPDSSVLTFEQAAEVLFAMGKPLDCIGKIVGNVLEIECKPDTRMRRQSIDDKISMLWEHMSIVGAPPTAFFRVFAGEYSIDAPIGAIVDWLENYQFGSWGFGWAIAGDQSACGQCAGRLKFFFSQNVGPYEE